MSDHQFDDAQKARMDNPDRRKLLPQDHILSLLNIRDDDTVLDVGAGAGYFTFPLTERTNKTVYALDIEQNMLDYIRKQAKENKTQNLTLLQEQIEQIPLEDNHVDRVLASMVLHEVQSLSNALQEIYRVLKAGGRFVVIDWIPEPGETKANRIDSGDMQRTAENAGFTIDALTTPSEQVYAITFIKPEQD